MVLAARREGWDHWECCWEKAKEMKEVEKEKMLKMNIRKPRSRHAEALRPPRPRHRQKK